jgi:hypothetical protein
MSFPQSPALMRWHPFRPPDWRIRRADTVIQEAVRTSRHHDDEHVIAIIAFLERRLTATHPTDLLTLADKMPALFYAFEVHETRQPSLRWLLEARILGRESPGAIAAKIGISPEAVAAYANAFFDVSDRLDRADFISQEVLEPLAIPDASTEYFWKKLAYSQGAAALDEVIANPNRKQTRDDLGTGLQGYTERLWQEKTARAITHFDPESDQIGPQFLRASSRPQKIEPQEDTPKLTDLHRHIMAFIEQVQFPVGDERCVPTATDKFENTAAELRDEEMMRVRGGENLADEKDIESLQLPTPELRRKANPSSGLDDGRIP